MFIILVHYSFGLEKIDEHLQAHRAFLDKYYGLNKLICSGARVPRTGGIILCKAATMDEAMAIISEDPFYINHAAEYEVIEFTPTKFAQGLEGLL